MKKIFAPVQLTVNSLPGKSKMHMLLTLVFIMGILLTLFIVLKPASPAKQKFSHHPVDRQQETGGDEPLYYPALWEFMRTRDPKTNNIPSCMRGKEMEFASRLPKKNELLKSQSWVSIGPNNTTRRSCDFILNRSSSQWDLLLYT